MQKEKERVSTITIFFICASFVFPLIRVESELCKGGVFGFQLGAVVTEQRGNMALIKNIRVQDTTGISPEKKSGTRRMDKLPLYYGCRHYLPSLHCAPSLALLRAIRTQDMGKDIKTKKKTNS